MTVDYYMDGYLKKNLDMAKNIIQKDWDMLFIYDGSEGVGKSVKAMQDAYYFDNTFNVDRITFTPNEFRKQIVESKPYQAVVFDEAYTGLSSRATMSRINRTLIGMLAEIRQKNLFVCVVMPTFFDLDKYVALWRSRALIHVYTGENFQRGRFAFFNVDRKKQLYIKGKKFYNYGVVRCNFHGKFMNKYPVDEAAYRLKKKRSLTEREIQREKAELKKEIQEELFRHLAELEIDVSHKIKRAILGMPESTYFMKLKQLEEGKME